ncbi:MAG TPA: flagellar hook-basal body complex protein FliE [Candidatus Moranbacteria bacterium]|nr:flagellar hook-basal body complex protein FliE [Candidatus Moranbacteria bacterium]
MADITIGGKPILSPIHAEKSEQGVKKIETPFGTVLKQTLNEINDLQIQADQMIEKVEVDNSASLHDAIIAIEKADISFKAMMQVRNKIIEAYQEVMRMQV